MYLHPKVQLLAEGRINNEFHGKAFAEYDDVMQTLTALDHVERHGARSWIGPHIGSTSFGADAAKYRAVAEGGLREIGYFFRNHRPAMIDVHRHLDLYRSPGRVIAEIDRRGTFVIAVTTTPKAFPGNVRLTEGRKRIRVAVGLHPELVATRSDEVDDVQKHMPQTKYVGEIGIDGSPEHAPSLVLQSEVFTTILKNAETLGGKGPFNPFARGCNTRIERHRKASQQEPADSSLV